MLLKNEVNDAYRRITKEYRGSVIPSPFTLPLYDRITRDLESLELVNDEYVISNISVGDNGGIRIDLVMEKKPYNTYSVEYVGDEGIYWQVFSSTGVPEDYIEGVSFVLPFS